MSLPDLAAVLWRQRDMLERLSYRLECEQLLVASGRTRWLSLATSEVESQMEELRVVEMQRAAIADAVAVEVGLEPGATLEHLAAAVQPPWTEVLLEHRQALVTLTGELATLAEANKHLLMSGVSAIQAALGAVGVLVETPAQGYDAQGRTEHRGAVTTVRRRGVDRAL